MLYDDGFIEKIGYEIYNKWFDEFNINGVEYVHFYIRTIPSVSKFRVDKRARKEETIPLEYLVKCHEYHDAWLLNNMDVIVLDGNQDITINPNIDNWYKEFENILYVN
jgi:hypothetical protein